MTALEGGSQSIFGISGTTFASEFNPGYMPGSLMQFHCGKNWPNPGVQAWQPDYRDFAPALGLSWSLPWLGRDKTVFRAGYGIAYEKNFLALLNQLNGYGAPAWGGRNRLRLPPIRTWLIVAAIAASLGCTIGNDSD